MFKFTARISKDILKQIFLDYKIEKLKIAEEKGVKIGITRGKEEGIKEEKIATARKMKEKNMPINSIIEITELTREEIENI